MLEISSCGLKSTFGRGDAILTIFGDGHWLVIFPHYNSSGLATTIEEIRIISPQRQYMAEFYSPFQNPVLSTCKYLEGQQFGFDYLFMVHEKYTLDLIVSYLMAAWQHLKEAPVDPLTGMNMWDLVKDSEPLVAAIQAGEYPLPTI